VVAAANLLDPGPSSVNATAHCVIGSVCVPPVSWADAFVMLLPMITTGPRCIFEPAADPAAFETYQTSLLSCAAPWQAFVACSCGVEHVSWIDA